MKKLLFLFIAIIGFCSMIQAQDNPCAVCLTVEECSSPGLSPTADITITLYYLNGDCTKQFSSVQLPISYQYFPFSPCSCDGIQDIYISVKLKDQNGNATCYGELFDNYDNDFVYVITTE